MAFTVWPVGHQLFQLQLEPWATVLPSAFQLVTEPLPPYSGPPGGRSHLWLSVAPLQ